MPNSKLTKHLSVDDETYRSLAREALKVFAVAAMGALGSLANTDVARAEPPLRCKRLEFEVALSPGAPADARMAAWLCARGSIQHKTIQLLIHGASYDHTYWDFPLEESDCEQQGDSSSFDRYSYVKHMTSAGYATLAVDRIGYGESTRPYGQDLYDFTLHSGAFTIHQVVQAIRSGGTTVPGFGPLGAHGEKIELVGFSLGANIAATEASTYGDVDGVVLTGFSHIPGPGGFASFGLAIPACQDPKFAWLPCDVDPESGTPLGYMQDVPFMPFSLLDYPAGAPTRMALFYYQPGVEQCVYDVDHERRESFLAAELGDILATIAPETGATANLHVPTLLANGEYDFLLCDPPSCSATRGSEVGEFPSDACLEIHNVPEVGHTINLHRNAPQFFQIVEEWSNRRIGSSTKKQPTQPCL